MPFNEIPMLAKKLNYQASTTRPAHILMEIRLNNCSQEAVICYSNLPTNGLKAKDKELKSYSKNMQTSKKHTR